MEDAIESFRRKRTNLYNDRDMRIPRPTTVHNKGVAYEDLGSDFKIAGGGAGPSKGKPQIKSSSSNLSRVVAAKKSNKASDELSSNDELDLLANTDRAARHSTRKLATAGSLDSFGRGEKGAHIDGAWYNWKEGVNERREKMKPMKFTKDAKDGQARDVVQPLSTSAGASDAAQSRSIYPTSDRATKAARNPFKPPTKVNPPGGHPSSTKPEQRSGLISTQGQPAYRSQVEQEHAPQRDKSRPKPRPKPRPVSDITKPNVEHLPRTKELATFPMEKLSPLKEAHNSTLKEAFRTRKFPMDAYSPPPGKGKSRGNLSTSHDKPESCTRSSKQLAEFPLLSPLSSPARKTSQDEPTANSRTKTRHKNAAVEGRAAPHSKDSSSSEEDIPLAPPPHKQKSNARPFPMEIETLESVGPLPAKRGSPEAIDTTGDGGGRDRDRDRKRVRGAEEILRELMRSADMSDSDEDVLMDPNLDPSTLCPWCDEPLPPVRSSHLQKLMKAARSRSYNDPRVSNPLGLHAPATVFLNVCHRHRFERHHFPLAQRRGWPMQIDWESLPDRIFALKARLQTIVDDADEDFEPGRERQETERKDDARDEPEAQDDKALLTHRPRKGSLFWIDVVRSVRKRGSNNLSGIHDQMSNFSKTQPGYYGELGAVILSQTLYELFPPAYLDPTSVLPLTPTDFVQRILLPEAALLLIMSDMKESREDAIMTMRDSAQYGVAMFPDDSLDAAGDNIIRKRAHARYKQLEQEEHDDNMDEECNLMEPCSSQKTTLDEFDSGLPVRRNAPRKATARKYADSDSGDVDMPVGTSSSHRRKNPKPASGRTSKTTQDGVVSKPPVSSMDIDISDAPSSSQLTKARPKPRPRYKQKHGIGSGTESDLQLIDPRSSDSECQVLSSTSRYKQKKEDKGSVDVSDLLMHPTSSDMERSPSQSSTHDHEQIIVDSHRQLEADTTPKPKKHKIKKTKDSTSRSSSVSTFGLRMYPVDVEVETANQTPRPNGHRWTTSLRQSLDSEE